MTLCVMCIHIGLLMTDVGQPGPFTLPIMHPQAIVQTDKSGKTSLSLQPVLILDHKLSTAQ